MVPENAATVLVAGGTTRVVGVARAAEVVVRTEVDGARVDEADVDEAGADGAGAALAETDDPQPAIATSIAATSAAAVC